MLRISAAYFTSDVYFTPVDLGGMSLQLVPGADNEYYTKPVRQIQAVRNAVKALSGSYMENHTGAYCNPEHLLPMPYFVPQPGSAWTPTLTFPDFFLRFTDACITTHGSAVFTSETTTFFPNPEASPVSVYIKFVSRYGIAAH